MRSMKRREFLGIAGAGMLAGIATAEAQQAPTRKGQSAQTEPALPDLRTLSKQVAPAMEDPTGERYLWLSDHTVLFLRAIPGTKTGFRFVLVDTGTGQKSLPEALNSRNAGRLKGRDVGGEGILIIPPKIKLSPDGRWLLWKTREGQPDVEWVCTTLDNTPTIYKAAVDPVSEMKFESGLGYWLRDSSAWVELVSRYTEKQKRYTLTHANVYRPGVMQPIKSIAIEGLDDGLLTGTLADGRCLLFQSSDARGVQTKATFTAVDLDGSAVKLERRTLAIPPSEHVDNVTLSPDGNRLAWELSRKIGQELAGTIYVSKSDGTEMQAVGTAPTLHLKEERIYSFPSKVCWLPDSSHLSFVYNRALHTVAV